MGSAESGRQFSSPSKDAFVSGGGVSEFRTEGHHPVIVLRFFRGAACDAPAGLHPQSAVLGRRRNTVFCRRARTFHLDQSCHLFLRLF